MQAGRPRVRVRGGGSREAFELTVSAAAEGGGCEPAAASAPAVLRPAPRRGRRRPRRGAGFLPLPRNLGGRGPEAGAQGDVTARAGSAFWRRGRLPSRVSAAAAAAAAGRNVVASTRDEMWSEGRYDYERLPRERVPPRSHASDGYHRVVNVVPKRPPLLDKRPPLLDKRPPLLARPDEGGYSRYYSHVDYRECDEGRSFSHDRRSGPPHRGDEPGYRWTKDDHSTSRQPEYRDMRDGFRRKIYSSHYSRDRSPHKRDAPFFRESPVGRKDSPHSRSGSSVSSRSYSPERSRTHSFHQSQHRKSARVGASYKQQNEANPGRGKERSIQSLKTSRDTSPSSSSAVSSSKVLDKPSRLTDKELAEAESKWANEKLEKADENNLDEIAEFEVEATAPLFIDQTEEPESNTTDGTELYEDSQLNSRSKAIALKTKEIEQVYRQDCETFGMVVKMLIEKDPSLEKSIQFALRQNLHEIGERCVEELKHFITEYDNSTQDFGDPF